MMRPRRRDVLGRILLIGFALFGLISSIYAGFAQAAEAGELCGAGYRGPVQDNIPRGMPGGEWGGEPEGIAFQDWRGFAINENQSFAMRVSIESVRSIGPICARKLLSSNVTLEEAKREILAQEENVTYRGHLRLGESIFRLTEIKLSPIGDNLTMDADIALPMTDSISDDSADIVGHIMVNISRHVDTINGEGVMIMTAGQKAESYKLHLSMPAQLHPPPMPRSIQG
jgi:hypothetical protein